MKEKCLQMLVARDGADVTCDGRLPVVGAGNWKRPFAKSGEAEQR